MKEVSFKLYEFDELSDKSRKAVVERRRYQVGEESAQSYSEDWAASLEKFQEIMGITVRYDVPYDGSCSSYSFDFNEAIYDNEECIIWGDKVKGRLLARFLNKIYYRVRSRKYIHSGMRKNAVYCDGKKSRYSNIMWEENNCPLPVAFTIALFLSLFMNGTRNGIWKSLFMISLTSVFTSFSLNGKMKWSIAMTMSLWRK